MAAVTLAGVCKAYGEKLVVRDVDLDIRDGELMVLVGPSGCGKTTTLRMVAGLEEITRGEMRIGNRLVNHVHPKDRDIAMVFQSYALYPHMTVYENIAFGLRLRGMPESQIDERVRAAAKTLGIDTELAKKPKALSGGQRQRVAMGRAIVRNPAVFLFDEPLSNLDARFRVTMRVELKMLQRRYHTTTIYVTHDQTEAMTLADRIAIMEAGLVRQVGTPQEVFDTPANRFVGGFIGSPQMNFLSGRVESKNGIHFVRTATMLIRPGERQQAALASLGTAEVSVGIRPNALAVRAAGSDENTLVGTIEVIENLGTEKFAYVATPDGTLTIQVPVDEAVHEGDTLAFGVRPERLHVFDAVGNNVLLAKTDA